MGENDFIISARAAEEEADRREYEWALENQKELFDLPVGGIVQDKEGKLFRKVPIEDVEKYEKPGDFSEIDKLIPWFEAINKDGSVVQISDGKGGKRPFHCSYSRSEVYKIV